MAGVGEHYGQPTKGLPERDVFVVAHRGGVSLPNTWSDQGTEGTKGLESQSFRRVLDVVEVLGAVISLRLLALHMRPWQSHREQGRQITDGGKQRAAPGHGKLITFPPCADGAREGGRGRVWRLAGGYASLTPVCNLSPLFPVALPRAHMQG